MNSLINVGTDLLNIYSKAAGAFGAVYALGSGIRYLGFAQNINPLTMPTFVASNKILEGLIDLTCKNVTKLQHFHELGNKEKEIDKKLIKHGINPYLLMLVDKNSQTPKVISLIEEKEKIGEELKPLQLVSRITTLALIYFKDAATTLVAGALNSSVSYLPSAALTLTSSLSITPITLVIGTIAAVGLLIHTYRQRKIKDAYTQEILKHEYNKEIDKIKFERFEALAPIFESVKLHQEILESTLNELKELYKLEEEEKNLPSPNVDELERINTRITAYTAEKGHIATHMAVYRSQANKLFLEKDYQNAYNDAKPNLRFLKEAIKSEKYAEQHKGFQEIIDKHKTQKEAFNQLEKSFVKLCNA